ncbi:MAG: hypothetical protein R2836_02200 [Chitinophagales bacterium]
MKEIIAFIILIVLGIIAHLFLPWWSVAIVAFLVGLGFIESTSRALLIGFLGVFILWGAKALISSYQNDFILVNRMAELLPFKNGILTILVTAILGGIIGMLSTLSGYFLQTIGNSGKRKRFK